MVWGLVAGGGDEEAEGIKGSGVSVASCGDGECAASAGFKMCGGNKDGGRSAAEYCIKGRVFGEMWWIGYSVGIIGRWAVLLRE